MRQEGNVTPVEQVKEKKVTLLRYVRSSENGWVRRKFAPGKTRGWEQRIDGDCLHFGADVTDLGEYQLRWFENIRGISKPRYESAATSMSAR
jgi:hypothetical protein